MNQKKDTREILEKPFAPSKSGIMMKFDQNISPDIFWVKFNSLPHNPNF